MVSAACAAGLLALLLDSSVDFDFYIPANAMLAAWLAGIGTAGASKSYFSPAGVRSRYFGQLQQDSRPRHYRLAMPHREPEGKRSIDQLRTREILSRRNPGGGISKLLAVRSTSRRLISTRPAFARK